MSLDLIYRLLFVVLLSALITIRVRWHRRAAIRTPGVRNPDEGVAVIVVRALVGPVSLGVVSLWLFRPDLAIALPIPDAARWLGAAVVVAGLGLLEWVHRTLDTNFSPFLRIREDQTLITTGPYRTVRHPMYTAFLVLGAGFALLTADPVQAVPYFVMVGLVIVSRTPKEEAMMLERFGDDYRAYMARTGALFPRLI